MFKVTLVLSCVLAIQAQHHIPHRAPHDESPKPYEFAYETDLDGGRMGRKESGDGSGRVVGSYHLSEDDGRSRVVDYVADVDGFRASVKTNEPGTKSENPADVSFYSSAPDVPHAHIVRTPVRHAPAHHVPVHQPIYAPHASASHPYYIHRPYFY